MAGLCPLTAEPGPIPGRPESHCWELRRTHPWEEGRENFAGFPLTRRTGRWEGPRSGTGERRAAPAWRTRGPAAAQGGESKALPPCTLLRALIHPPSRGPAGPAKNRLHGHPAADLALGRQPWSSGHWRSKGRASRPGEGRGGAPEPEPAGGCSERASGGAAWADAADCDPRAEA